MADMMVYVKTRIKTSGVDNRLCADGCEHLKPDNWRLTGEPPICILFRVPFVDRKDKIITSNTIKVLERCPACLRSQQETAGINALIEGFKQATGGVNFFEEEERCSGEKR